MSTHSPVTEATLRAAAQACIETDHAVAAVLFGSRARQTAGTLSDWDVCLITDDATTDETTRQTRLEAEHPLWGNPRIEVVWLDRSVFESGVAIGSLEANIVRDARVLAGNMAMAKTRTVPFEARTVLNNIRRAGSHLHQAMVAAGKSALDIGSKTLENEHITMVTESIAGAEALGRALCALTETEHTGDHRIGKAGRQIGDRAGEGKRPLGQHLMDAISVKVQQMNDSAQTVRKIEYGRAPGEPEEKTIARFTHALEADLWLRQGLLRGVGPWAQLQEHPRRAELREELAEATKYEAMKNSAQWSAAQNAVRAAQLRKALGHWVSGLDALSQLDTETAQETKANLPNPYANPQWKAPPLTRTQSQQRSRRRKNGFER